MEYHKGHFPGTEIMLLHPELQYIETTLLQTDTPTKYSIQGNNIHLNFLKRQVRLQYLLLIHK